MKSPISLLFCLIGFLSLSYGQISWGPYPGQISTAYDSLYSFAFFTVKESRGKADSRDIQIAFTLLKSQAANPSSEAVLFLPGGPGAGYSQIAGLALATPYVQELLREQDVILLDPRGCGYARPSLCDAFNQAEYHYGILGKEGEAAEAFMKQAMADCADTLRAHQVDVEAYNSIDIAKDIEELRQALGYTQWNLRGHSYGTKFAQTLMQLYPESIRSAVLTGVVDPERDDLNHPFSLMYGSLTKVIHAFEADSTCGNTYPNLKEDLRKLILRVEKTPITVPSFVTEEVLDEPFKITARSILAAIHTLLYDKQGIEILPALIHSLAEEEDWIAAAMASPIIHQFDAVDQDMQIIISSNDYPFKIIADTLFPPFEAMLARHYKESEAYDGRNYWSIISSSDSTPALAYAPLQIPVLLISGEFDPITPPTIAERVISYYPNSYHVIVPGRGHDGGSSAGMILAKFIQNPLQSPDLSLLKDIPPTLFQTNIVENKGLSLAMAHISSNRYVRFIPLGIFLLCSLLGFLTLPIQVIRLRNKPEWAIDRRNSMLLWLFCLMSLIVLGSYGWAIMATLSINPYVLAIGLPGDYSWITWLAWGFIILILTMPLMILRNRTKTAFNWVQIMAYLGCLGIGGFLLITEWI